ncbi:MAG: VrrA/YqfQ family protein [Bacilli bacterium]
MNYYNYPFMNYSRPGLFSSLFQNKINWGSLLNNTSRTLNLINQAVPIIQKIPPIYRNAKTMFKVMNEFRRVDTPTSKASSNSKSTPNNKTETKRQDNVNSNYEGGPTFFL